MAAGPPNDLPPEGELLLCCARLTLEVAHHARIRQLLQGPLDGDYLVELASRHGLRPLLYRHLNAIGPESCPPPVFTQLWRNHETTTRRNRVMTDELLRVSRLLDAHAIPSIPYKGPALAAAVYGDVALREFSDLDIVLRNGDVVAAKKLLLASGYSDPCGLEPDAEAAFLRSGRQYHLVLIHESSAVMVELHWKTDRDHPVESLAGDSLWSRPSRATLQGQPIRSFTREELLLVLCLHGAKHHWSSLGWLVDIAELVRQDPAMDWEWITRRAKALGAERRLALGLNLAHRLLDVRIPAQVLDRVVDAGIGEIAASIIDAQFARGTVTYKPVAALRRTLRLYDRRGQRFVHCVNVIFSPTLNEMSRWHLPRHLAFLYFPLRLGRLAMKHGRLFLAGRS